MRGRNGNAVEPILAGLWRGHKLGRARRFCSHVGVRLVEQIPMSLIARKVLCSCRAVRWSSAVSVGQSLQAFDAGLRMLAGSGRLPRSATGHFKSSPVPTSGESSGLLSGIEID